jgi:hypothetical protein
VKIDPTGDLCLKDGRNIVVEMGYNDSTAAGGIERDADLSKLLKLVNHLLGDLGMSRQQRYSSDISCTFEDLLCPDWLRATTIYPSSHNLGS